MGFILPLACILVSEMWTGSLHDSQNWFLLYNYFYGNCVSALITEGINMTDWFTGQEFMI